MSGVSEDIYNGSKHGNTALENNLGLKDYEKVEILGGLTEQDVILKPAQ